MKHKRIVTIAIFAIVIFMLVKWVYENKFAASELPIRSTANTIAIASNGCCLWAENVKLIVTKKSKEKDIAEKFNNCLKNL